MNRLILPTAVVALVASVAAWAGQEQGKAATKAQAKGKHIPYKDGVA